MASSETLSEQPANGPAAYLITFTCYGTHLHGNPSGSVDRLHNVPSTPFVETNAKRERFEMHLVKGSAATLSAGERMLVLQSIRQHAACRRWLLYTAHIRSNHVHVVVASDLTPEKIMTELKAYASRLLNRAGYTCGKRWAKHGSTRYLWELGHVSAAVNYVVNQQGQPMAVYCNPDPYNPSPERK